MRPRRSCGGECVRKTVFWSWQSDLDGRVTRDVIRTALDEAITILAAELEEADRPSLTSDTQGVAGTPDIVATILAKIDEAAVFVGDVTPIALSDSGKACANPNVLLEMGYANKASPQGLFARQRFLGHKRNMGYATRFNRAIGSLSGWNSPAGSRLACSQR